MNISNIDREIERIRIEEKCGTISKFNKQKISEPIKIPCDTCEQKSTCTWENFITCKL